MPRAPPSAQSAVVQSDANNWDYDDWDHPGRDMASAGAEGAPAGAAAASAAERGDGDRGGCRGLDVIAQVRAPRGAIATAAVSAGLPRQMASASVRGPRDPPRGVSQTADGNKGKRESENQEGRVLSWRPARARLYLAWTMRSSMQGAPTARRPCRIVAEASAVLNATAESEGAEPGGGPLLRAACAACEDPLSHVVACDRCGTRCWQCDAAHHADEHALDHVRVDAKGNDLHPGVFVDAEGSVHQRGLHVDYTPWSSCPCGAWEWQAVHDVAAGASTAPPPALAQLLGYTHRGVVRLLLPTAIRCGACGGPHADPDGRVVASPRTANPFDHVDLRRWWPMTARFVTSVLYVPMLQSMRAVQQQKPSVGFEAQQRIVERLARQLSGDAVDGEADLSRDARRLTAGDSVREWGYMQHEIEAGGGEWGLLCAVCGDTPTSMNADAILKLYRFNNGGGAPESLAYHHDALLAEGVADAHRRTFPATWQRKNERPSQRKRRVPAAADTSSGRLSSAGDGAASLASAPVAGVDDVMEEGELPPAGAECVNIRSGKSTHGHVDPDLHQHGVYGCSCPHGVFYKLLAMYNHEDACHTSTLAAHVVSPLKCGTLLIDNGCGYWNGFRERHRLDAEALRAAHAAQALEVRARGVVADRERELDAALSQLQVAYATASARQQEASTAQRDVQLELAVRQQPLDADAIAAVDRARGVLDVALSASAAAVARIPPAYNAVVAANTALSAARISASNASLAMVVAQAAASTRLGGKAASARGADAAPSDGARRTAAGGGMGSPAGAGGGPGGPATGPTVELPHVCQCAATGDHLFATPIDITDPSALLHAGVNLRTAMLHGAAHCFDCRLRYMAIYTPGTGWLDGEGLERSWALLYALGRLVRLCSPMVWHDLISEAVHVINADKYASAHKLTLEQLRGALERCTKLDKEAAAVWADAAAVLTQPERAVAATGAAGESALATTWLSRLRQRLAATGGRRGGGVGVAAATSLDDADAALLALGQAEANLDAVSARATLHASVRAHAPPVQASMLASMRGVTLLAGRPVLAPDAATDAAAIAAARATFDAAATAAATHAGVLDRFAGGAAATLMADASFRVAVERLAALVANRALLRNAVKDAESSKGRRKARLAAGAAATRATGAAKPVPPALEELRALQPFCSPALKEVVVAPRVGTDFTDDDMDALEAAVRAAGGGGGIGAPSARAQQCHIAAVRATARRDRAREEVGILADSFARILRSHLRRWRELAALMRELRVDVDVVVASRRAAAPPGVAAGLTFASDVADSQAFRVRHGGFPARPVAAGADTSGGGTAAVRYACSTSAVHAKWGARATLVFLRGRADRVARGLRRFATLLQDTRVVARKAYSVLLQAAARDESRSGALLQAATSLRDSCDTADPTAALAWQQRADVRTELPARVVGDGMPSVAMAGLDGPSPPASCRGDVAVEAPGYSTLREAVATALLPAPATDAPEGAAAAADCARVALTAGELDVDARVGGLAVNADAADAAPDDHDHADDGDGHGGIDDGDAMLRQFGGDVESSDSEDDDYVVNHVGIDDGVDISTA